MFRHEAVDGLGVARPHQLNAVVTLRLLVEGRDRRQRHSGGRRRSRRAGSRLGHTPLLGRFGWRRAALRLSLRIGLHIGLRRLGWHRPGAPHQLVHHRRGQGAADAGLLHQFLDHFVGDDDTAPLVIGRFCGDRLAFDLLGQRLGIGLPIPGDLIACRGARAGAALLGGLGCTRRADVQRIRRDGVGQRHPLGRCLGIILAPFIEQG